MATLNHTLPKAASLSRAARAHLRRIYAVEAAIRSSLDETFIGTVGGESCPDLRQVLAHLEAAAALLESVREREMPRFLALRNTAA